MVREGSRWVVVASLALSVFACERDPLEVDCPDVAIGGLVDTEVRGDQVGDGDDQGEWIELFNGSGSTIDLVGLRVILKTLDGSSIEDFTVRRPLTVSAGSYVTLGRFATNQEPTHVSYGYADELDRAINSTGAIELVACGVEVDQVVYMSLPGTGTLALDGDLAPSAVDNDDQANFCVDAAGAGEGTPQQENPPCS
jgi:hypothetical protein